MEKKDLKIRESKSISLTRGTVEEVKNYPNYSYGQEDIPFSYKVESMLESMCELRKYTMKELRNYFTVEEAAALCDMENGILHSINVPPKRALCWGFEDACEYEYIDKKWEIDREKMLDKLSNLSQFQAYVVQTLTAVFWDKVTGTFEMKDIAEIFNIDYNEEAESLGQ